MVCLRQAYITFRILHSKRGPPPGNVLCFHKVLKDEWEVRGKGEQWKLWIGERF